MAREVALMRRCRCDDVDVTVDDRDVAVDDVDVTVDDHDVTVDDGDVTLDVIKRHARLRKPRPHTWPRGEV